MTIAIVTVLAAIGVVAYGQFVTGSKEASSVATATALRSAIAARAAADDVSPATLVSQIWAAHPGDSGAFLAELNAGYSGEVTFTPGTGDEDATLKLAVGNDVATLTLPAAAGMAMQIGQSGGDAAPPPGIAAAAGPLTQIGIGGSAIAVSPDGGFVAIAGSTPSGPATQLYRVGNDGSLTLTATLYEASGAGSMSSVKFSPAGNFLATSSRASTYGYATVYRYNADGTMQMVSQIRQFSDVGAVAFSPDGSLLAFTYIYKAYQGSNTLAAHAAVYRVAANGQLSLARDGSIDPGSAQSVTFSPSGDRAIVEANSLSMFTISGTSVGFNGIIPSSDDIGSPKFTNDGRYMIGENSNKVLIYQVPASGWPFLNRTVPVTGVALRAPAAIHPSGKYYTVRIGSGLTTFAISDGGTIAQLAAAPLDGLTSVSAFAFSADGSRLIAAGGSSSGSAVRVFSTNW